MTQMNADKTVVHLRHLRMSFSRHTPVMKQFASIVLLVLASMRPPSVGGVAPDFKLADQNGKAVSLSAARGGKVVLVFYRGYW
jgi:hypothetical protein